MAKKDKSNLVGSWSFLIGVLLAVIVGFFSPYFRAPKAVLLILVFLGILIGLLNIKTKESSRFMIASTVLVLVALIGSTILAIIPQIGAILNYLIVMIVPAAIIVALKEVYILGKD